MTRLGIIGYGNIAQKHIDVFRLLGAEFSCACNRSEARRRAAESSGSIPRTYDDPVRMIESERIDGLLITASVMSQFDLARMLIPRGIPILLEKPPGTSTMETEALCRLAEAGKVPVMVGLNRRFYSVYHRAIEAMGGRDAVTNVSVEWSEDPKKMIALGHDPAMLPLLNYANSLHGIDLLTFFGGEIARVDCWGRDLDPQRKGYRWQMSLHGVSTSGVRIDFESSWDVPGRWRLVVDVPDARLVSAPLETAVIHKKGKAPEEIQPSEEDRQYKPGFHGQAAMFLDVVHGRKNLEWPAATLKETLQSMTLAERLTRACQSPVEK